MGPWQFRFNENGMTEVYYHGIKLQGIVSANITATSDALDVTSLVDSWNKTQLCNPKLVVSLEIISNKSETVPILGDEVSDSFYQAFKDRISFLEHELDRANKNNEFEQTKVSRYRDEVAALKSRNAKLKKALKSILNETVSDD